MTRKVIIVYYQTQGEKDTSVNEGSVGPTQLDIKYEGSMDSEV